MSHNKKPLPDPPASAPQRDLDSLLVRAKGGDGLALNELLEALRPLLRKWADRLLNPRLRIRKDPSDLAQDTLMEFFRTFPKFEGKTQPELLSCLRKILEHNHIDALRAQLHAAQRTLAVEVSLDEPNSGSKLRSGLQAEQTPADLKLERREQLARALAMEEQLPDSQRRALSLWRQRYTFREIAQTLNISEDAAKSLVRHAKQTLKERLPGGKSDGEDEQEE